MGAARSHRPRLPAGAVEVKRRTMYVITRVGNEIRVRRPTMSPARLRVLVAVAVVTLVVGVLLAGCRKAAQSVAPTAPGKDRLTAP